jgi:hypothetical protein
MTLLDSETFASSTSYSIPVDAKIIVVECVGAGGGGGSGRRVGTAATAGGGSGGNGGGIDRVVLAGEEVSGTVTVTIGAGGTGGAARSSDSDGQSGGNGGISRFGPLYFWGQSSGFGGTTSSSGSVLPRGRVFSSTSATSQLGMSAGRGTTAGIAGAKGLDQPGYICGAGASGGAITASTSLAGAAGGKLETVPTDAWSAGSTNVATGGGGAAGTAGGGNASAGGSRGNGGGGGGGNYLGAGGNGGAGGVPGGGGGGGGAGITTSGAGGEGGRAEIKIWIYG